MLFPAKNVLLCCRAGQKDRRIHAGALATGLPPTLALLKPDHTLSCQAFHPYMAYVSSLTFQ